MPRRAQLLLSPETCPVSTDFTEKTLSTKAFIFPQTLHPPTHPVNRIPQSPTFKLEIPTSSIAGKGRGQWEDTGTSEVYSTRGRAGHRSQSCLPAPEQHHGWGGGLYPYPRRSQASPMLGSWSLLGLGCLPTCSPWKDSLGTISFSPGKN